MIIQLNQLTIHIKKYIYIYAYIRSMLYKQEEERKRTIEFYLNNKHTYIYIYIKRIEKNSI